MPGLPGKLIPTGTRLVLLAVGVLLVLPQVVGFAAARVVRRFPPVAWALAASGVIGVLWALAAVVEYHGIEQAGMADQFRFSEAASGTWIVAVALMALHFVIGNIFGVLDQRARARAGK
jgi:hypothetical protein